MVSLGAFRTFAFLWALLGAATATALAADFTVPPTPHHYVTDEAGALDDATKTALESELQAFEKATGHQVIVYIGDTTGAVPLETYTAETAHTWHVGRKGKDDGAILFLFMSDHKVRIEVGYGLEGSLSDAAASQIIQDEIVPRMKDDDPNGAVTAGTVKMLAAIDPSFTPTATAPPAVPHGDGDKAGKIFLVVFLIVFCIPWIVMIVSIVRAAKRGELITKKGSQPGTRTSFWSSLGSGFTSGSGSSSDDDSSSSDDDDFSSGGGDFGGGGASGSW
jgi:uncharacterized protein